MKIGDALDQLTLIDPWSFVVTAEELCARKEPVPANAVPIPNMDAYLIPKESPVGTVFLISVLKLPTEAQRIEGMRKSFLVTPQFVLADDARSASNKAALLAAQADATLDPDRIEVLARPAF